VPGQAREGRAGWGKYGGCRGGIHETLFRLKMRGRRSSGKRENGKSGWKKRDGDTKTGRHEGCSSTWSRWGIKRSNHNFSGARRKKKKKKKRADETKRMIPATKKKILIRRQKRSLRGDILSKRRENLKKDMERCPKRVGR